MVGSEQPCHKSTIMAKKGFRCCRCYYAKWGGQKEKGAGGEETGQMHLGGEVYMTCRDMSRK